ncbi:MAG: phosphoenolpyruvate carboxykinase (ATP) [Promethearchaeota archaeon]|nr:MAG: phosphoenolpyruvate carboxykinase (ATP) [Candidatus Lokiarchaeota archaeon]
MNSIFDLNLFAETSKNIYERAKNEKRLIDNPSYEELRKLTENEPGIIKTKFGNLVSESEPTSRSAMFTKNSVDSQFGKEELDLLKNCERSLNDENIVSIDRIVGNLESNITVRLIVPLKFVHLAYGGGSLFAPVEGSLEIPTYEVIMFFDDSFESNKEKLLPDKDITIRLAMLENGRMIKICRNSNYIGEYKKGVFAAQDWRAKFDNIGIFLHAGCREDYLQSSHGDYIYVRSLLIALSANGKTTTTCKVLGRKDREKSWLIQDDGGILLKDGSFKGFEYGGIFVKTEGVNPSNQIETYYGLLKPNTFLENVHVDDNGDFDFFNFKRTSNGRAVIHRKDFMHASNRIDVPSIDNIILITRGPIIPAISKLTHEQATALMIIGQSMESSAGDPTQAGKLRNEFFYDPFVSGDRAEHANLFYDILKNLHHINCYLINTGGIGEGRLYKEITIDHTIGILDSLFRGGLEDWTESPTGLMVPKAIRTVDQVYLHPETLYSKEEFLIKQKEIEDIRYNIISKYDDKLNPKILNVFKLSSNL